MWWLDDIIVPILLILGIWGFLVLVGFRTRLVTRKTDRTAESMYGRYADSKRKQRKYARERGGQWRDEEVSKTS